VVREVGEVRQRRQLGKRRVLRGGVLVGGVRSSLVAGVLRHGFRGRDDRVDTVSAVPRVRREVRVLAERGDATDGHRRRRDLRRSGGAWCRCAGLVGPGGTQRRVHRSVDDRAVSGIVVCRDSITPGAEADGEGCDESDDREAGDRTVATTGGQCLGPQQLFVVGGGRVGRGVHRPGT
jgi:hypothetical protein